MTEKEFFKKYPDAAPSRFVFKDGKVFFKINPDNEYRLADIESRAYQGVSDWTKYLTSYKDRGFGIWFADGTIQPYKKNHTAIKDVNKFKVYVTDDDYFVANLPSLDITNTSSLYYEKNSYLTAIIAAYVSTYVCGISTKHLEYNNQTPGIITSMVRYHLYYQMSKFLTYPKKLERYLSLVPNPVKKHKPTHVGWVDAYDQGREEINTWLLEKQKEGELRKIRKWSYSKNSHGYVTGIKYQKVGGHFPNSVDDYKMFIATTTNGLTKIGQKLFQQSIESCVYSILGAQAKTRWSIVGEGAKSLQTQDVFHKIVKESLVESDVTITISNMRTAIETTNVVLNMAISPGMILVPSDLIIQKKKIPGYNNILKLATDKMKFGKNADVNYKVSDPAPASQSSTQGGDTPKTTNSESKSSAQGGNTGSESPKTTSTPNVVRPTQGGSAKAVPKPKSPKISVASEILGVTMMIGGFLISKYVF